MKYKNLKIIIKEIESFDYYVTRYNNNLILYFNKRLDNQERSRILHRSIKKCIA